MGRGSGSAAADVNKPIFIGGGGEGYLVFGQDLTEQVEPYIKSRNGGGNFYTHWDDSKVMEAVRATHAAGRPVILIGHSWGGSDAIAAARRARGENIIVDLLITIDPVGQPNYLIWSTGTYKGIARHWVTVIADKPGIQAGDPVAHAWGKTPAAIQHFANRIIRDTNAGHANFRRMMITAGAEALIANAYRARPR
jgi:pimeloyl-ACP methyl ester carboxylesterase